MLDVDLRHYWGVGHGVFSLWFIPASLLAKFASARRIARLSLPKSAAAAIAMTAISWLLAAEVPLAVIAWGMVHIFLLDRILEGRVDPYSWISVLILSAIVGAVSESAVLRFLFKHKFTRQAFWLLFFANAVCISLAAFRMTVSVG
jgi:hypothetical protein